jgi:hypothetical protein
MTPEDLQTCRTILSSLISPDRENINYLFLEPVDPTYFTDYLTIVKKPMDLRTLGENLEAEKYENREEFYNDANLIWENAIAFNGGRSESQFVVGLAKKMSAAFERERKKAERRSIVNNSEAEASSVATAPEKKKIKLSLKRSSLGDSTKSLEGDKSNDAASVKKTNKKIKLKLKTAKSLPPSEGASKTSDSAKSSPSKNLTLDQYTAIAPMTPSRKAQCYKALSSLKRRQASNCKWFLKPVNDAKLVKDYREKIEVPMDLGSISSK